MACISNVLIHLTYWNGKQKRRRKAPNASEPKGEEAVPRHFH